MNDTPNAGNPNPNQTSSSAEDLFVELFQEAVGFVGAQCLQFQFPFIDVDRQQRYIDFALQSPLDRYAFEIDGEYFHRPDSPHVDVTLYRDGLTRQNSLIWQGWKVYRWTDTQLANERERVVEQLRLFLEREIAAGALEKGDLLPLQEGADFALHGHQSEALAELERLRAEGKTIALITHATGTGKTHVAVMDARRSNHRTLYLAHTEKLPRQTAARFGELWPGAMTAVYKSGDQSSAARAKVVLSTFQSVARNLSRFDPHEFGYIIVDEAHHAVADTFSKVIQYFQPQFLLGLTATPDRLDNKSLLEIFRETAHRLSLEEAIKRSLLVPIRCLRVDTNVDLSRVRYNGADYRLRDLEQVIRIPGRDELIADVYVKHASGRRAVCFCVNVDHAERVAEVFRTHGVKAASVSGRIAVTERESILADYQSGDLKVLCACDMLNEGWDSPSTEVLLMARPTLSKILYVQQLGRGTRVSPGKEYLFVFDFVDKADRYAQSLNVHRVFGKNSYRPGALVAAPDGQLEDERRAFEDSAGCNPLVILSLNIYETSLQPIDIFRWQDEAAGMIPASELARELRVDDDTIRKRVKRREILPDLSVPVGDREQHYFKLERLSDLRAQYNVSALSPENVRDLFMEFVADGDMASSYKPVLLTGMLRCADRAGRISVQDLLSFFRDFYASRANSGRLVEALGLRMARVLEMDDLTIECTMLKMPFEKFERKGFFHHMKDLAFVRFEESLWRKLSEADKQDLERQAAMQIETYYRRLETKQPLA
jgi:superfamily II DNA or RNA helicase